MRSTREIKDDSFVALAFWADVEVFFHWLTLVFFLQTPPHPGVSSLAELYWPQIASVLPTLCLHGEPRMLSEAHPTQDRECRWLPHRSRLGGKVIMLQAPPEEPKRQIARLTVSHIKHSGQTSALVQMLYWRVRLAEPSCLTISRVLNYHMGQ